MESVNVITFFPLSMGNYWLIFLPFDYRLQLSVKKQACMQYARTGMSFSPRILRRVTEPMSRSLTLTLNFTNEDGWRCIRISHCLWLLIFWGTASVVDFVEQYISWQKCCITKACLFPDDLYQCQAMTNLIGGFTNDNN